MYVLLAHKLCIKMKVSLKLTMFSLSSIVLRFSLSSSVNAQQHVTDQC